MAAQWSREHGGTDWLLGDPRVTRYLCNSMSFTNDITQNIVILNHLENSPCTGSYKTPNKLSSCLVTYTRYLLRFPLPEENSFIPAWVEFQAEKHHSKVRVYARNSKQWQLNWTLTSIEPAILCVKITSRLLSIFKYYTNLKSARFYLSNFNRQGPYRFLDPKFTTFSRRFPKQYTSFSRLKVNK